MRDVLIRLWRYYRSPQGTKLYRYVMGSVITTIVSFGVLTLVYGVFRWWSAVPSTLFANLVATVPAYYLNRSWTWGKYGKSDIWREVVPFWVISVLGIVVSMGTAALASDFSHAHGFHHFGSTVVVDGANLVAFGVMWVGKYLFFQKMFKLTPAVETEADLVDA